jgi:hypothetical protein
VFYSEKDRSKISSGALVAKAAIQVASVLQNRFS